MRRRYEVEDRKNVYKSRDKRLLRRGGFVENLVWCRRDHLDIFGNERAPFDIFDEFRLDLVGQHLADTRVLFDVGPLRDQEETLRYPGSATFLPDRGVVRHRRARAYPQGAGQRDQAGIHQIYRRGHVHSQICRGGLVDTRRDSQQSRRGGVDVCRGIYIRSSDPPPHTAFALRCMDAITCGRCRKSSAAIFILSTTYACSSTSRRNSVPTRQRPRRGIAIGSRRDWEVWRLTSPARVSPVASAMAIPSPWPTFVSCRRFSTPSASIVRSTATAP